MSSTKNRVPATIVIRGVLIGLFLAATGVSIYRSHRAANPDVDLPQKTYDEKEARIMVLAGLQTNRVAFQDIQFQAVLSASHLRGADGLSVHPANGTVFFSEEDIGRVCSLNGNEVVTVIDADTPVFAGDTAGRRRDLPLRAPEGLAFSSGGDLYVAEDIPGGRLLRFAAGKDQSYPEGRVVPIPGDWSQYAWEGLAVNKRGGLLLAGSDLESITPEDRFRLPMGAILYRDPAGQWWVPYQRLFASFSSVCFSKSGKKAVYVCELSGETGWFDLEHHRSVGGPSSRIASAPEGLCVLPDGSLLIAEEKGHLVRLDPSFDRHVTILEISSSIESVTWDSTRNCAWVTADGSGHLLKILPGQPLPGRGDLMNYAEYHPIYSPRHVPAKCPDYLAEVLALGGLDFSRGEDVEVSFTQFASRVPLIALDAEATPVYEYGPVEDPIERVQFVIFRPNEILSDEHGVSLSLPAFAARARSGTIYQTTRFPLIGQNYSVAKGFDPKPYDAVLHVPQPGTITVSPLGIATVQFLGLGRTPDFALVVNPRIPEDSYMVVQDDSGRIDYYHLRIPQGSERKDQWVIAYAQEFDDAWTILPPVATTPEKDGESKKAIMDG